MSVKMFLAGGLGLGLVLGGCSPSACGDPRTDGLLAAAGCTAGGGYQGQTDALARTAGERQALAGQLARENAGLRDRLGQLQGAERQATQRLIGVNSQIASLDGDLERRRRQQEMTQGEYAIMRSELNSLNAQRARIDPDDSDAAAEIASLEAQVAELRSLID